MARLHPRLLRCVGNRIRLAGDNINAVGVMNVVIQDSCLLQTGTTGMANTVHKIVGAPFSQEWRRDISVWGLILGFDSVSGGYDHNGITFATRKLDEANTESGFFLS